mmetsp:Transcript_47641/g.96006  ORF Transcript_47641/g.96006 Transcript_47641/m.96006 type:complete len:136 (+) Transcript_47641:41-448(+)|eukprot:CAMPEP_0171611166 /NCGR_PEP_ID=MMETSP0990-20121206/10469_1 /TAXON_ID=483369 /ORGANISM="non described non described, Strain CCMP2098" /LENGTH=135 /DNA_ID=CAMNT_0012174687 /DNA_START=49 /DNA_END=456 /DNA_ORIENTATION=-
MMHSFRKLVAPAQCARSYSPFAALRSLPMRLLSTNTDLTAQSDPLPPGHTPKRGHKDFDGIVVSDKMQKSIVVAVTRFRVHQKYNKRLRYTTKFMAHDEDEVCEIGDKVRITMSRPISKRKFFKYHMMLKKADKL